MALKADEYIIKAIENATKGEEIEGVVLGGLDIPPWFNPRPLTDEVVTCASTIYKVISWNDAKQTLEKDTLIGCGAIGLRHIFVWTTTRVIFVIQHDHLTWIESAPRNPIDGEPFIYGG